MTIDYIAVWFFTFVNVWNTKDNIMYLKRGYVNGFVFIKEIITATIKVFFNSWRLLIVLKSWVLKI